MEPLTAAVDSLQERLDELQSDAGAPSEISEVKSSLAEAEDRLAPMADELNVLNGELLAGSLLGQAGHAIEPAVRPLGWDWKVTAGVIASFPAREVVVAVLGTILFSIMLLRDFRNGIEYVLPLL